MNASLDFARSSYGELGVNVDEAIAALRQQPLSIHCWQGDDVGGFETARGGLDKGGIQVTGNYPGRAGSIAELRDDLIMACSLIPGRHRLSLHASYGDFADEQVDRDEIDTRHFTSWLEWGMEHGIALDFNATLFAHRHADDGFTLSHKDSGIRRFWIDHVKQSRNIAAWFGEAQGSPCIHNIWIPDGSKDLPVDRYGHRRLLTESLDEILSLKFPRNFMRDAVESKLFGIGSEAYVTGSHEFYLGYSLTRHILLCLDMGHFHPTESLADKISAIFQFQDELLLHVSRPMRWDSDHVVILNDDLLALMQELARADVLEKTHIGLDFFDATINRIGAYALGSRAALKALLAALLEPRDILQKYDAEGNFFARLALLEELKTMPLGLVWDEYCRSENVPTDRELITEVMNYERRVLSVRS
ncbi:MAG: L-rhamnose isomerase [Salinispira sp.]